jgi:lycopene cyclase domain-containing protein
MSKYLIINILIIIVPLFLSFEKNLKFYRKVKPVLKSILIVSSAFIIWDVIATQREDWAFNPDYLIGVKFFGLPIEEILFFITVPYACIFIFETVKFYIKDKTLKVNENILLFISLIIVFISVLNYERDYTFTVTLFTAVSFLLLKFLGKHLFASKNFWITLLISYIPFLIVNYFLTSIPIVTYNSLSFSDIRFITIPIEDFFYSFSMISMWILFYNLFETQNG